LPSFTNSNAKKAFCRDGEILADQRRFQYSSIGPKFKDKELLSLYGLFNPRVSGSIKIARSMGSKTPTVLSNPENLCRKALSA
jgi:hypothetical protein